MDHDESKTQTANWGVYGHQKQIAFLSQSMSANRVAHAYLFAGPQEVGKKTLAYSFAKRLLCTNNDACNACAQCKSFIAQTHADFLSLPSTDTIKVEQVRELLYKLALKPYQAKYKVAVIDNAQNLTVEASNALLKTLEEAREHTVIILIAPAADLLLKTIVSRTQKLNFGYVEYEQFANMLPKNLDKNTAELIIDYAYQLPGRAYRLAFDENYTSLIKDYALKYDIYQKGSEVDKLLMINSLIELEDNELRNMLGIWLNKLRLEARKLSDKRNTLMLKNVYQASKLLDYHANNKLLFTNLMLNNINV